MSLMRQTFAFYKFVVALSVCIGIQAHADTYGQSSEGQEAGAWLKKIQSAAQRLNYSGTFVYQQGSQMRTSRITHVLIGKEEREKLEILDGDPREYIRSNDEVVCYVPGARTLFVEKRVAPDVFPAILATEPTNLTALYEIKKAESGRVAGRDCQAVVLQPKDKLRYGYKLWADKATGLLLRAQTLSEKGEVVEQIAFTQIAIGNIPPGSANPTYRDVRGWQVENAIMSQASLSGWVVKELPPGFKKIREVRRMVSDKADTGTAIPAGEPLQRRKWEVSQMVFSDGLAAISVFIEPGSQSRTEGSMQQGAVNIIGKRQGDFWLTIVGEVPPAAIRQVANSIEFKSQ
jgi:sigma-E factor negative regulatory protein RseB